MAAPCPDLRDPEAFERAYRDHRPYALAAALGILRDPPAAEDVVQEVFAQLWTRPGSFDATRGTLRSYVTVVARSRALDRWRTRTARDAAIERFAAHAQAERHHERSADELAARRERSARAVSAIDGLPAPQRQALLLAFGRELTAREIAEAVGVPVGTAKSRIRLGLQRLRAGAPPLAE
jgi:RNA polymerase sigma-70 factor (ECF subfamily)